MKKDKSDCNWLKENKCALYPIPITCQCFQDCIAVPKEELTIEQKEKREETIRRIKLGIINQKI